jgi:hypothetical protein
VIGATYLDGGWPAAAELVLGLLGPRIAEAALGPGGQDYKTRLQELAARHFDGLPSYEVVDEGPDHAKRFLATVRVGDRRRGRGEGRSKKQAEQAAARDAWQVMRTVVAGTGRVRSRRRTTSATVRTTTRRGGRGLMPELPEIETLRRDLEKEVVGKKIKAVEVYGTKLVRQGHPRGPPEAAGRRQGSTASAARACGSCSASVATCWRSTWARPARS